MPSVTIDAGVLAAPPVNCSAEDAHRYVETLLDWSQLLEEPWVAIYMSERASESLLTDGLYPLRDQLKRLFAANGIVEYDVNTVASVVDRLLQLTPSFETYFRIRDVLTEDLTTQPDILRLCAGAGLQSDLARCVVLIAILRRHCHEPVSDHSLILRRAPGRTIRVRALIHELEHERYDLTAYPSPPNYFEGDVLACDDFRGLLQCLDEATILLNATDEVGIQTAIQIAVYKARLAREMEPDWDDVPQYRVGHAFWGRLQELGSAQQISANLLRAIVDTLEGASMARTHALRTGPGGGNPQRERKRDQAKAWRRDIDSEHHLHYWACEGGLVEIAWVGFPHKDITIPE
ncbi:MAG TPA: hypothetical protein VL171_00760 [Verrucomicrobiae bacterium]|nr:hypothetical protein [Verrucomicrobiae bacterium]